MRPEPAVAETFAPTPFPAPPPFGGVVYQPVNPQTRFDVTVITLGAEWRPGDWRLTGEYGQRISNDTMLGPASKSGYVTLARAFGNWTPYVTHAQLRSPSDQRRLYQDLNATPVPLGAQAPPLSLPPDLHDTDHVLFKTEDEIRVPEYGLADGLCALVLHPLQGEYPYQGDYSHAETGDAAFGESERSQITWSDRRVDPCRQLASETFRQRSEAGGLCAA